MTRQSKLRAGLRPLARAGLLAGLVAGLAGCGGNLNPFNRGGTAAEAEPQQRIAAARSEERRETIWDLFENRDDPNVTVGVNKYIWQASLEVLNFLPIESVDPFSGVIVTGFGTPPGGGTAYRATVLINDPARHVQYGFELVGVCVWITDVAPYGNIVIGPYTPVSTEAESFGGVKALFR